MVKAATAAPAPAPSPGPVPVPGTATVISSAALVQIGDVAKPTNGILKRQAGHAQPWMEEAWGFFDRVPELRFGVQWLANACSRARLFAAEIDPDGSSDPEPVEKPDLVRPVTELFGGQVGQSEMLRRLTTLLSVPGEGFIAAWDDASPDNDGREWDTGTDDPRQWLVLSRDELTFPGGQRITIKDPEDGSQFQLPPGQSMLLRLWRPHGRYGHRADSPVLGLRDVLRELTGLSAHVLATVNSRLAGAGLLVLPDSAVPPNPGGGEGTNPLHDDPFMDGLIRAMVTPLQDPSSASAVVPITTRVADESVGKIQHLSFATNLDETVTALRDSALKRLAIGMDMPPEILLGLGMSATSSWNAFAVEESSLKISVAPMLSMICQGLTEKFYRPALRANGIEDVERYAIWFDTSSLVQRPNRGPDAITLYEQGLLAAETVLREHGFDPDSDAPSEQEFKRFLLMRLVLSNPSLLADQFPELDPAATRPGGSPAIPIAERQPDPTGMPRDAARPVTGQDGPPQGPVMASASPAEQADEAVVAALSRIGRRIRANNRSVSRLWRIPEDRAHTQLPLNTELARRLLVGRFDDLTASAGRPTAEAAALYTHRLLTTGTPHRPEALTAFLHERGTKA